MRRVETSEQIRVSYPNQPEVHEDVLRMLYQRGGNLIAYLVYELSDQSVGLFVCEHPRQPSPSNRSGLSRKSSRFFSWKLKTGAAR